MILCDVNVLIYAFRRDSLRHREYRAWLLDVLRGPQSYGVADLVLSAVIRIVTHPRVFAQPSTTKEAFHYAEAIRKPPNAVPLAPGARHWPIFRNLCEKSGARGGLIPDAYLAALAIESGSEWITTDRDYSRFEGLRWRHPFDA